MKATELMYCRTLALACCFWIVACGSGGPTTPTPSPSPGPTPSPAPAPAPAPQPPFTLSGHVTDRSGATLSGTTVTILDGPDASRTTTADANGQFRIEDLRLAGFTVRFRHDGYDSEYRGIRMISDISVDVAMRPVMRSLAGPWSGTITATSNGSIQTTSIPEVDVTHSGADITGVYPNTVVLFTGTLRNAAGIGATTDVTGTIKLITATGGRSIITCTGTGAMTGTVDWMRMTLRAPQVVFDCGGTFTDVSIALLRQQ